MELLIIRDDKTYNVIPVDNSRNTTSAQVLACALVVCEVADAE